MLIIGMAFSCLHETPGLSPGLCFGETIHLLLLPERDARHKNALCQ
jgi:hypothetical protein